MRYRLRTLLIVLAVGPPLSAIPFLVFTRMSSQAIDHTRAVLGVVEDAVLCFQLDTGALPVTLNELYSPPPNSKVAAKWAGPYLNKPIQPDFWGNPLKYSVVDTDEFKLSSAGEDGMHGTSDDLEPFHYR